MKREENVLLLNFELHYVPHINFATFQRLVNGAIAMLIKSRKELGSRARVIWKITTAIREEKDLRQKRRTSWRFFTQQVNLYLFDIVFKHLLKLDCCFVLGILKRKNID